LTREETATMLTLLRVSYPNFYSKMKKTDMEMVLALWTDMFIDDDVNIVKYALKELIATHTGFPPDIAAVKNKIKEIVSVATNEPTNEELWAMLKRAVSNGTYGAKQEFDKLPPILQKYCGSHSVLRDMALLDADIFNTVTRGQFLKQIKIVKDREEYNKRMPENIKALISSISTPMLEAPEMCKMDL